MVNNWIKFYSMLNLRLFIVIKIKYKSKSINFYIELIFEIKSNFLNNLLLQYKLKYTQTLRNTKNDYIIFNPYF
jgi:hypothetical protein